MVSTEKYHLCDHVCVPEQVDFSLCHHDSFHDPWSGAGWDLIGQIGGEARSCRGRQEVIGSA